MKLIDILVGSGDGMSLFGLRTKYLAMDPDGRVYGYTEMPTPGIIGWSVPDNLYSTDGRGCLIQIDRDDVDGQWQSAIITREQYESALAAKNEGWIEWGGGECPVEKGTRVDVRHRDGDEGFEKLPGEWGAGRGNAAACKWTHSGRPGDIIAYRLSKPQKAAQAKADESDMNECISQDAEPVWNGEGFPPVGCECEFRKMMRGKPDEFRSGIVSYLSEHTVVIVVDGERGEFVHHPVACEFRPIRSEADKKRDAAIFAINEYLTESDVAEVGEIYDAIVAGKIPGVKLED